MKHLQAIPVTENVFWVGALDWTIRDFHGYETSRGTTYNAYLILAEKVTLIDTVKRPFFAEMMGRIASIIEPTRIDIIVSNHAEMDHSGALPETIAAVQPQKVYASKLGVRALNRHLSLSQEISPVGDGETISLGNMTLQFLETRMLHWPDSMFSYLPEQRILFSQDAFGMHLATSERFADEIADWILEHEAAKYYANILLPLSPLVLKLLARVQEMKLPVDIIAPDHGPIWRKDIGRIIQLYHRWAEQKPTGKAVVVYDTMWGSTALLAQAYAEGLQAAGACVRQLPLAASHRSEIATELLEAGALLVGTPTINNQMFPTVADCLTYMRGLKRQHLLGTVFGSYGWSGEAVGQAAEILEDMKIERAAEPVRVLYVPEAKELQQCREVGAMMGEKLRQRCA